MSSSTSTARSPRTINLNGTLVARITRPKTTVASRYAHRLSAIKSEIMNTIVPNSLVLGSRR